VAWMLQQLVDGVRHGDASAIRAMVEQLQGSGYGLAVALLKDTHLAEDAVQEALIEAILRIESLRDAQALPAWFRQIVRSQCNRTVRRRGDRTCECLPECEAAGPSPAAQAAQAELRQRVRGALAELSSPNRRTAELFYLDGFSLSEVATTLDIPLGTVKRRLHDARRRLRNILIGSARAMEK
jgi:RNA polymerase sigma factor (sigma-70 family)